LSGEHAQTKRLDHDPIQSNERVTDRAAGQAVACLKHLVLRARDHEDLFGDFLPKRNHGKRRILFPLPTSTSLRQTKLNANV
jgi:hypothetical protein